MLYRQRHKSWGKIQLEAVKNHFEVPKTLARSEDFSSNKIVTHNVNL